MKDTQLQLKLINQALAAARASIELSLKLLADLSGGSLSVSPALAPRPEPDVFPGLVGTFDGRDMVTADGRRFAVPENYASKTVLVYGDKLKMIEAVGVDKIFKQIERVKRQRVSGVLAQKGEGWQLVTAGGTYRVLTAAVKHFNLGIGQEVFGLLPRDEKTVPFAAIESLATESREGKEKEVVKEVVKVAIKVAEKDEKKPEVQKKEPDRPEPKKAVEPERPVSPLLGDDDLR